MVSIIAQKIKHDSSKLCAFPLSKWRYFSLASIYLFKVSNDNTWAMCSNDNTWAMCGIFSKLTINTPERRQWLRSEWSYFSPASIYLFKVSNNNTWAMCEISSKLTINTLEQRQWLRSDVFILSFEHMSHCSGVSIVNFEQLNTDWVCTIFSLRHFFKALRTKTHKV